MEAMSVRSAVVPKNGLLWVKQHTVKLKPWQLKYVCLKKRPGYENLACLEWYESQEAYNNSQNAKELMFDEIRYAGSWSSQSKEYAFIIIVSDQKQIYLAAKTKAERTEWLEAFNTFLQKPSSSCVQPPNDSTSCDHISQTYAGKDSMLPTVDSKRQNFPVIYKDSTLDKISTELKLNPKTEYLLNVNDKCITVLKEDAKEPRKSVLTWLLATIRTYNSCPIEAGRTCNRLLTIETGRQSSTGEGVFHFITKYGDQIANQIRLNTNKSFLAKMNSLDGAGSSSPDTPRMSTSSVSRPPDMPPRHNVKGHDHAGIQFQMYDEATATETASESFASYVRQKNGYIHVLTSQEEVEKFTGRKCSRPSIEYEPTFSEDGSSTYIEVLPEELELNGQSHEGMPQEPQSYDADHATYIDVLQDDEDREGSFEGAEDNGKYVDVATMGSRDGEDEKKEYSMQFPMDGYEASPPSSRGSPLSARGSPLSTRGSSLSLRTDSHSSRGRHFSALWHSSVSSDNDVFRDKENTGVGDVFSEEHAKSTNYPRRISENDESESFEEYRNSKASSFHEGEDQMLNNAIGNEEIRNLEDSQRKGNAKTNSWQSSTESDHVETLETLDCSANTSSGSETGRSARDSRELSDEVASGGEMQRRRTSSDTSSHRDSSGDSDSEGTKANELRNRSKTMNDVMLMQGCGSQLWQDLLEKINTFQDVPDHNNHPQLSRLPSVFNEQDVIAQLENPTKAGVRGSSLPVVGTRAGEIKYVCGECGWYKWSKGRNSRNLLKKEKKCERCKKVIKRSQKKDRSNSIFDRFKKQRPPSGSGDFEPSMTVRPPLDTPQPSFVKQLHNRVLIHNPALDSKLGKLGIAPSLAHTAHAQRIGGEARTSSTTRCTLPISDENSSPSARGTLSSSRSEGALGKGLLSVEKLPKMSGEKDNTLTRTISSPVCTAPTDNPLEFLMPEQGGDDAKLHRKLSGGNLSILPEVEDISEEPGSPCVECPPTIPPRTREEPPPIPPRRSSGASARKDELEKLRRAQTDPTSSLTPRSRGSPKLLEKKRLSRTMTDPGFNLRNNNIRNAVSMGDLLENESKIGCNLVKVVSLSLGEGLDPPPPLPPRKYSGSVQPPPLSPRRVSNDVAKQNSSCEPQRTLSPVSFESNCQTPENCSTERDGQKLPLTSKRSAEARKNFLSSNPIYHENVIDLDDEEF